MKTEVSARTQSAPAQSQPGYASHARGWRQPAWNAPRLRKPMWYNLPPIARKQGLISSQALAVVQHREDHGQLLIPTGEAALVGGAAAAGHALLKRVARGMFNQLRKDGAVCVYAPDFVPAKKANGTNRSIQFQIIVKGSPTWRSYFGSCASPSKNGPTVVFTNYQPRGSGSAEILAR